MAPEILNWKELPDRWQPFPGAVVKGIPNEIYHQLPGVSKSGLDLIERSAYRYLHRAEIGQTDDMALGSLRHTLLLEEQELPREYHIIPSKMVKNDKHKAYQAELETAAGRTVIKEKELVEALVVVDRIQSHEHFQPYLEDEGSLHLTEVSIWWELGPHLLRFRPDFLLVPYAEKAPLVCFDLKTLADSSYSSVQYQGEKKRHFPKSAAFYSDGLREVFGRYVDYMILAAEYNAPYEVNIWCYSLAGVDMPTVQLGRKQYYENLNTLQKCLETDQWPRSAKEGIEKMELSHWASRELSDE